MNMVKKIIQLLVTVTVGCALGVLTFWAIDRSLNYLPSVEEFQDPENISHHVSVVEQATLKKSRNSAVRVFSMSEAGKVATSSGTYIKADGKYYILSVMHGLVGGCDVTGIWTEIEGFTECLNITHTNALVDYAFIEVDAIPSLTPVKIPRGLPSPLEWKGALANQTKTYYTGYPNSSGPLTFPGVVVGYAEGDYVYMNSFAWGGASGSGVFTVDGMLIGYILAIDVGQTDEYGTTVLENIVVVVPTFKIDWTTILE